MSNTTNFTQIIEVKAQTVEKPTLREFLHQRHNSIAVMPQTTKSGELILKKIFIEEIVDALEYLDMTITEDVRTTKAVYQMENKKIDLTDNSASQYFARVQKILKNEGFILYKQDFEEACKVLRGRYSFDPVLDKLENTKWDGTPRLNEATINKYFTDKHGVFAQWFRAFIVSSVARAYNPAFQAPVWIIAGGQGLGKSYFCSWLASYFGVQYYAEKSIDPDSKDDQSLSTQKIIVEIPEAGATFKKDREVLKRHFTASYFDYRPPYARETVQKPHLASYIATLNLSTYSVLKDDTGNRRYILSELERVDKKYSKELPIEQLWAEAVYLYQEMKEELGTSYEGLIDVSMREEINEAYHTESLEHSYLEEILEYTGSDKDFVKTTEVRSVYNAVAGDRVATGLFTAIFATWLKKEHNTQPGVYKVGGKAQRGIRGFKLVKASY